MIALPSNLQLISVQTAEHRKLITTAFIKKGQLILENEPVAIASVDPHHCSFCLSANPALCCSRCKTSLYCNRECQTQDYKYSHKLVCGRGELDSDLEMLMKVLASPTRHFMDSDLLGHPLNLSKDYLSTASRLTGKTENKVETLLCQFRCNNFSITDAELYGIAEGAYALGSLINHSCTPSR
jgi:hypothetical protein